MVANGNQDMLRVVPMCVLAVLLKAYFIVEQPLSSIMAQHKLMAELLTHTGATNTTVWMGAWGGETPKPLRLWSTAPWISKLCTRKPPPSAIGKLTTRGPDGSVTGGPCLRDSAAYPSAFGKAIAQHTSENAGTSKRRRLA